MIYSKVKYDAISSFYNFIELGENFVIAAEQSIKQTSLGRDLEEVVFVLTIIERILLNNVTLSPYLIDRASVVIKKIQSISEDELTQQIRSSVYLTNLSMMCQRVSSILQREYGIEI